MRLTKINKKKKKKKRKRKTGTAETPVCQHLSLCLTLHTSNSNCKLTNNIPLNCFSHWQSFLLYLFGPGLQNSHSNLYHKGISFKIETFLSWIRRKTLTIIEVFGWNGLWDILFTVISKWKHLQPGKTSGTEDTPHTPTNFLYVIRLKHNLLSDICKTHISHTTQNSWLWLLHATLCQL